MPGKCLFEFKQTAFILLSTRIDQEVIHCFFVKDLFDWSIITLDFREWREVRENKTFYLAIESRIL